MDDILVVKDLRKVFKLSAKQRKINNTTETEKVAVDGISFAVKRGEIYGLLGPNGAGITTTLRILSTLISADGGDAFIDGFSVKNEPEKIRGKIAFMTGELKLEDYFTPNYLFEFFGELYGVDKATVIERRRKLFGLFGIEEFAETRVSQLSTGMKQKTSLAVSMVQDPDLIIFDEPTNGLDVLTAKQVTDFLKQLKDEGKTIILSTHIFSLVEKTCDRVGIIIDGKLVADEYLSVLLGGGKNLEDIFFDMYKQLKESGSVKPSGEEVSE